MKGAASFKVDPYQTAIIVGVRVEEYIANMVLPDVFVPTQSYEWHSYSIPETSRITDTAISRTGQANELEYSRRTYESYIDDHGLDSTLSIEEIEHAQKKGMPNPMDFNSEQNMKAILGRREQITASLVFDNTLYPTGFKTTLSGADQWSDPNSDPIGAISQAMLVPWARPNYMAIGEEGWAGLRANPKVVAAASRSFGPGLTQSGLVSTSELASVLELEDIYVGRTRYNAAAVGPANMQRLWGKHALLFRKDPITLPHTMTFGITAIQGMREAGGRYARTWDQEGRGRMGIRTTRVGLSYNARVVMPEFGYLFSNVVA